MLAMLRHLRALAVSLTIVTGVAWAADDGTVVSEVTGRFQPSKPAVVMSYDVTYELLHIRLKRVAGATMSATEGTWSGTTSNARTPACLIDFHVASPHSDDEDAVTLNKRTVSVLSLPDLKMITYAKENDEFIKPFFRKGRRMKYIEIYNFECGGVTYRHHDLVSGTVETNLPGMTDLARQSTEVADVLQTLYAAYRLQSGEEYSVTNKIHFNVGGVVKTFTLQMKKSRISVPLLARKLDALHSDIQPQDDGDSRNESFSMWCVPFREFAAKTRDPELKKLAATSLEYSMLPLSGEYSLFLGAIECTLTNIGTCAGRLPPGIEAGRP